MASVSTWRRPVRLAGALWQAEVGQCPAPGKDEDAVLVADDFVAIADGSTPLVRDRDIDARSYADTALRLLRDARDRPAEEMFRVALERSERAESVELGASCTVGLVRSLVPGSEASVLGDCLVLVALDGRVDALEDDRLERFDRLVARRIAEAEADGPRDAAELPEVLEQLIEHRRLANRRGTYWLFAGDPAAAGQVRSVSVVPHARAILLCSDGFSRLVDPLGVVADHAELMQRALASGLAPLFDALRTAEREPGSMARAPRLSLSDDATAVLLSRA